MSFRDNINKLKLEKIKERERRKLSIELRELVDNEDYTDCGMVFPPGCSMIERKPTLEELDKNIDDDDIYYGRVIK